MRKPIIVLFAVLVVCLVSCDPDNLQTIGQVSISLGNNIIGAEKEYKTELKALEKAGNELVKKMTASSGVSLPTGKDEVEDLLSSINSFSSAPSISTTKTSEGFTYEKKVDLSEVKMPTAQQDGLKNELKEVFTSFTSTTPVVTAAEKTIDDYTMKEVVDTAIKRVVEFGKMPEYTSDSSIQHLVELGLECLHGAERAIGTIVSHAQADGDTVTLEDVTIASIANVVKKTYGMLAIDDSSTGSQILRQATGATEYIDALSNLGVIPFFDPVALLEEFLNRH